MPGESFGTGAGVEVLVGLVDSEYNAESIRKDSLEGRTQFVIMSSGAFVTLLLGLERFGIVFNKTPFHTVALCIVIGAIAAFIGAAILCLKGNNVLNYGHVDLEDVGRTFSREWTSLEKGRAMILTTKVKLGALRSTRQNNDLKADWLAWAIRLEIAAIVLLGIAVSATVAGILIK